MKCTRCGKEMKIKEVEVGKDELGNPIYNRYGFCYDCKIKINLDKKKTKKQENAVAPEKKPEKPVEVEVTIPQEKEEKPKKKKTVTVGNPKNVVPDVKVKKAKRTKGKKKHGFVKWIVILLILAGLGTAAYYKQDVIKGWVKLGLEKFDQLSDRKESPEKEEQKEQETPVEEGTGSEGTDQTPADDTVTPEEGTGAAEPSQDGAAPAENQEGTAGDAADTSDQTPEATE